MRILTNKNNLNVLKDMIANAESEIMISSGWIRAHILKRVINSSVAQKIKDGEIKLRVVIRIGSEQDLQFSDLEVFRYVEELGGEIRYHRSLHTKMYIVDDKTAMLGSFNLTGGGFGTEDSPGANPETGSYFDDTESVKQCIEQFNEVWENDCKSISNDLLGFVLNPTNHTQIFMVGIKELEVNTYVQVRSSSNEYFLGKIKKVEYYSQNYFSHPSELEDGELKNNMFKNFSQESTEVSNTIKFLASHNDPEEQLLIADVKIVSRLIVNGDELKRETNFKAPKVGSEIKIADAEILMKIFNRHGFAPGRMIANDIEVGFDSKHLYNKHLAIYGSTGSGKSYFTKLLLSKYVYQDLCAREDNPGRVIVFDTHGEYSKAFQAIDNEEEGKFKLEKDQFEIIDSSNEKNLNAVVINDVEDIETALDLKLDKKEKEFLNDQIFKFKSQNSDHDFIKFIEKELISKSDDQVDYQEELKTLRVNIEESLAEYVDPIRNIIKNKVQYDSRVDDDVKSLQGEALQTATTIETSNFLNSLDDEFKQQLVSDVIQKNYNSAINKFFVKDVEIVSEKVINEIGKGLKNGSITFEELKLIDKLKENMIYCIDMSSINDDVVRYELAHNIMKKIFDDKKNAKNKNDVMDTVFVIEEAHNFAPEGGGKNNPAGKIIYKIATEGRKFDVGLFVITQRPAQVAKAVLAQCSTQVVFRMINSADVKMIAEITEGLSDEEIRMLPNLKAGEGIFSGVAIDESVMIKTNEEKL